VYLSALELFRMGPGPSSSRTLGAQRAALRFVRTLGADARLQRTTRVEVHLFGTLALAARESGSDAALVAGLAGDAPEHSDARSLRARLHAVAAEGLSLPGGPRIAFDPARDLRHHMDRALAFDGNAVRFDAHDALGAPLASQLYFTRAGGDVLDATEARDGLPRLRVPFPAASAEALLVACRANGKKLADLARANECMLRSPGELRTGLAAVAAAMIAAGGRGLSAEGTLPGGRERRAARAAAALAHDAPAALRCAVLAMAVAEESAAGGCVVAAPTHGAAGPVAALLIHWHRHAGPGQEGREEDFLLTAALLGQVLQAGGLRQAGCQSAVGVGAAMAAAGYIAALGGSAAQSMAAAAHALDRHWGLACDETDGRMQDPCIERNANGAALAVEAVQRALAAAPVRLGLDGLVRSMAETGRGMAGRHKQGALAGLARNVTDC
jgi:L-serine dehydratase